MCKNKFRKSHKSLVVHMYVCIEYDLLTLYIIYSYVRVCVCIIIYIHTALAFPAIAFTLSPSPRRRLRVLAVRVCERRAICVWWMRLWVCVRIPGRLQCYKQMCAVCDEWYAVNIVHTLRYMYIWMYVHINGVNCLNAYSKSVTEYFFINNFYLLFILFSKIKPVVKNVKKKLLIRIRFFLYLCTCVHTYIFAHKCKQICMYNHMFVCFLSWTSNRYCHSSFRKILAIFQIFASSDCSIQLLFLLLLSPLTILLYIHTYSYLTIRYSWFILRSVVL